MSMCDTTHGDREKKRDKKKRRHSRSGSQSQSVNASMEQRSDINAKHVEHVHDEQHTPEKWQTRIEHYLTPIKSAASKKRARLSEGEAEERAKKIARKEAVTVARQADSVV